jgi:hypothetical protein
MTLGRCAECGGKVSTKAEKCPHCGAPSPPNEVIAKNDKPTDWDKVSEWYEREIDPQPKKWAPEQLGEVERDVRSGFPQRTGLSKRNKVMLGVAGVLLLWVIVIALGGGDQRPSALVATPQPAEASTVDAATALRREIRTRPAFAKCWAAWERHYKRSASYQEQGRTEARWIADNECLYKANNFDDDTPESDYPRGR